MTLRDKLKNAFHKKSASKDIPQVEIVGSKVPPMSKDPGFRKSFNLGDRGDHGDEDEQGESSSSKNTSRPVSAAVHVPSDTLAVPIAAPIAAPVKPGQFQKPAPSTAMYTVDPYEGEFVSVSPRTKSTIPDSSTIGSEGTEGGDITTVPSLDLSGKAAGPIHTMEPIGEGKVLEGASQKLEAINKAGGVEASRDTYPEERGERDGGTLEPYPTRTSEASAAYGSGAYTAPQRSLVPQVTSDGASSVYSDDLSGSRPGLGVPRDTDASVYSQDEVSGQRMPIVSEEIAKKSGLEEEHVFNEAPGKTVTALKAEEHPGTMLRGPTAHDTEDVPQIEAIHSKSVEEEPVTPTATERASLHTNVLVDAHIPGQQEDGFTQPTRFHQPGDFFAAVQSTFPESAPATGTAIVSTVKGDDAESWSKGVISGIEGVDVKTPREERVGLSGLLDQASEEAVKQDVPVGRDFTSASAPAQRDFSSYTSRGTEGGFTLAGAGAAVSQAASNTYTTVADTVTGNNETGKTIKEALIPSTTSTQPSTFAEMPETVHTKTSGVQIFGEPSERTTEESPLERHITASQPTTYTPPVDNTTEAPVEKTEVTAAGIVPTISNAVSNAYNSAAQTITEATTASPTSTTSHIPSERDVDLEQGHGSREVTEGSTTTGGITGVVNNLSAAVAPSTETKQWASNLYDTAAKAVTGNTAEDKQADAFASILGGHTQPATGAIDPVDKSIVEATHPVMTTTNTVPHAPALEHDVPDVGDERPNDVPYGDQPITTTSNSLPVAEFNQATPSTAFGKHDIVRDTEGSQADKVLADDEFDPLREVRPKMTHADTMNTIDVVRDMPGGMW